MGNKTVLLMKHVFYRRQNANFAPHSPADHPERRPADHPERRPADPLPTVPNIQQRSSSSITSAYSMGAITPPGTSLTDTTQMITTELESITEVPPEAETVSTVTLLQTTTTTTTEVAVSTNRCSKFYLACRTNNINEVNKLLKTILPEDVDRLEPNGSTALHSASYHGHYEIVKLLLRAGADRSIQNKYKYLPFDEAANDEIKKLFLRVPNTNRLASSIGDIEWELIHDDVRETAAEERHLIKSIYDNTSGLTPMKQMFEKIEMNYINQGLAHFDGIDKIKRFFRSATKEQDPQWIIKAYSAETEFYKVLNVDIACGTTKHQNERRYIIALLSYHPILNQYTFIGTSYRVMQISYSDLQKYQTNSSLMTKSFLSSSIDRSVAEYLLCLKVSKEQEEPVRMRMDGTFIKLWVMCIYQIKYHRTALHIEEISQYTNEGEILIMPHTVFRVKQIQHIQSSTLPTDQILTEIHLEECECLYTSIKGTYYSMIEQK